jgi:hypothetical protein
MTTIRSLLRRFAVAIGATAVVPWLALAGCGITVGSHATPTSRADVSLSLEWPSSGAPLCSANSVTWRLDPVSMTGKDGLASTYLSTRSYSGVIPTQDKCVVSDIAFGMRTGQWRASVSTGLWTASCNTQVNPGPVNRVTFTSFQPSCHQ